MRASSRESVRNSTAATKHLQLQKTQTFKSANQRLRDELFEKPVKVQTDVGPMFEIGQDALCEHAGTLYPAKIVAIEPIEADATHDATTGIAEPRKYLVHYHGWKKRHDEWIPTNQAEDRLFPSDPAVVERLAAQRRAASKREKECKVGNAQQNSPRGSVKSVAVNLKRPWKKTTTWKKSARSKLNEPPRHGSQHLNSGVSGMLLTKELPNPRGKVYDLHKQDASLTGKAERWKNAQDIPSADLNEMQRVLFMLNTAAETVSCESDNTAFLPAKFKFPDASDASTFGGSSPGTDIWSSSDSSDSEAEKFDGVNALDPMHVAMQSAQIASQINRASSSGWSWRRIDISHQHSPAPLIHESTGRRGVAVKAEPKMKIPKPLLNLLAVRAPHSEPVQHRPPGGKHSATVDLTMSDSDGEEPM